MTVPVLARPIDVPYGYQNGRFNLIKPVPFQAADAEQAMNTACRYAVAGRSLHEHSDTKLGPLQLIVVGKFRPKQAETKTGVLRVLQENDVRLFSTHEVHELIDEIRHTAKDVELSPDHRETKPSPLN